MHHTAEYGIDPDIKIDIKESDQLNNINAIIEEALKCLKAKTSNASPTTTGGELFENN